MKKILAHNVFLFIYTGRVVKKHEADGNEDIREHDGGIDLIFRKSHKYFRKGNKCKWNVENCLFNK